MNNRGLLVVIALVLVGILGVMVVQYQESQKSPIEKAGDSISEAVQDVGDEIDHHTNAK